MHREFTFLLQLFGVSKIAALDFMISACISVTLAMAFGSLELPSSRPFRSRMLHVVCALTFP